MAVANILQPLTDVEEWVLEHLHTAGLSWGLAIVGLTLLIRLCTLPLVVRQFRSQREMRLHLPELRKLRELHQEDPARLQRETAAYYRHHGINPLASIGPLLLQIPVFISLYMLLRADAASGLFGDSGFLFIPDLTEKPHGAVLVTVILVYVSSQVASSAIATRALQPTHRWFAMGLPLLFASVIARFPAGLAVYSVTTSFWSLGQQFTFWRLAAGGPAGSAALVDEVEDIVGAGEEPAPDHRAPEEPSPAARRHSRSKKRRRTRGRR